MARKPSYKELEQRVKELEEEITERKKADRILVETMSDGLAVLDEKILITFVNYKFYQMLGYTRHELIGQPGTNLHGEASGLFIDIQSILGFQTGRHPEVGKHC